jgi:hypothetical protein
MKTLKELLETHQLKVGDHFRWQYDEAREGASYWCKSQMCIWDGKNFKDLFWSMGQTQKVIHYQKIVYYCHLWETSMIMKNAMNTN